MEQVVDRIKKIIMSPKEALDEVKAESVDPGEMIKKYVIFAAAIPAVALFIGHLGNRELFNSLFFCAALYGLGILSVFLFGKILDALAPHFNSTKNDVNAFKTAIYSFTPLFAAGIVNVNHKLFPFGVIAGGLYGAYVLFLALPNLMETPKEKQVSFTVVSAIAIGIVVAILFGIASKTL